MTIEDVLNETKEWQPTQIAELVHLLNITIAKETGADVENAWKSEARRRLAEIEDGSTQVVDGASVSARIRAVVSR